MAAPSIAWSTELLTSSNTTSVTVSLSGSTWTEGDICLVFWVTDGSNGANLGTTTFKGAAGFSVVRELQNFGSSASISCLYYRVTGSESGNNEVVCTWGASENSYVVVAQIDAASTDAEVMELASATVNGATASPDPPSVTLWESRDILMLAWAGWDGNKTWSSDPSNYTGVQNGATGTSTGCGGSLAYRQLTSSTGENPGTFGISASDEWGCITVIIATPSSPRVVELWPITSPNTYAMGDNSFYRWAQLVQTRESCSVEKVKVHVQKYNSPTDNVEVAIQADSSGSPSGTDLASGSLAGSGLTTPPYEFTLSSAVSMTAATSYWVVIRRSGSQDATNNYNLGYDSSRGGLYFPRSWTTGTQCKYWNGASWSSGTSVSAFSLQLKKSTGTNANVTAGNVVAQASVPTPSVVTNVSATVGNVAGQAYVPTPPTYGNAGVTAGNVMGQAYVPTPTVVVHAAVVAGNVAAQAFVPTPPVATGAALTVGPVIGQVSAFGLVGAGVGLVPAPSPRGDASVPTPSVVAIYPVTAGNVAAQAYVPTPTVTIIQPDAYVYPDPVVAQAYVPTPPVSTGAALTVGNVQAQAFVPTPPVSTGVGITAGNVTGQAFVPGPTMSMGAAVTAGNVMGQASVSSPTMSMGAGVTAGNVSGQAFVSSPSMSMGVGVTAGNVLGQSTVPTSPVATGAALTVGNVTGQASVPYPPVSAGGDVNVYPDPVVAQAYVDTPTTHAAASVTAGNVTGQASVPTPTVVQHTTPVGSTATGQAYVPLPTVVATGAGDVQVVPDPVVAVAHVATLIGAGVGLVPGTAVIGSVSVPPVTPTTASSLTPASVVARAYVERPTLRYNGNLKLTTKTVVAEAHPATLIGAGVGLVPLTVEPTASVPLPDVQSKTDVSITPDPVVAQAWVPVSPVSLPVTPVVPGTVQAVASVPTTSVVAGASVGPAPVVASAEVPTASVNMVPNDVAVVAGPVIAVARISDGWTLAVAGTTQAHADVAIVPETLIGWTWVEQPEMFQDVYVVLTTLTAEAFVPTAPASADIDTMPTMESVLAQANIPTPIVRRDVMVVPSPVVAVASIETISQVFEGVGAGAIGWPVSSTRTGIKRRVNQGVGRNMTQGVKRTR